MISVPKVLHVCQSDRMGGAAIAAHRLVKAQRDAGIDARMLVLAKTGVEPWIEQVGLLGRTKAKLARVVAKRVLQRDSSPSAGSMRTLAVLSTGFGAAANALGPDIVHLHWLGGEAMSLAEFAELTAPVVWTCHDQWAFCGGEHYAPDDAFVTGYTDRKRGDLDAVTFTRKKRHWSNFRPSLVCPSEWMAGEAQRSKLAKDWPVITIPNTLDADVFSPADRDDSRRSLRLPGGKILLFGAQAGDVDPRKGFDLLETALEQIGENQNVSLVTFGGAERRQSMVAGKTCYEMGRLTDQRALAALYSAADLFVIPSRADNLPNTMLEAQACGLRCVGFDLGGLGDIVTDPRHGELVPPFDTEALAQAILGNLEKSDRMAIRRDALARFGPEKVVGEHLYLYRTLMEETWSNAR